jgi:hypothetical protein
MALDCCSAAGESTQSNIDTEGGMLIDKTIDNWKAGGAQMR